MRNSRATGASGGHALDAHTRAAPSGGAHLDPEIANYVYQAQNIERLQDDGAASISEAMPPLETAFVRLAERHDRLNTAFGDAVASAERDAARKAQSGLWAIALACIAAAIVVTLVGREVARSIPAPSTACATRPWPSPTATSRSARTCR